MTRPSRRTLLCSTAAVIGLSAGCLSDTGNQSDDISPNDSADEAPTNETDGDDEPADDTEEHPAGLADYQTQAYQTTNRTTEPDIEVLQDADSATDWLDERASLRDTEAVTDFIDETDFETSILVSFAAEAPTPCYELSLESIDIKTSDSDDGSTTGDDSGSDEHGNEADGYELVLEAAVHETAADDEACIQVVTTVGRLVRVTFESEPLTTISATLVGHDGSTYGATMGSDSGSASASSSVESEWGSGSESQSSDS